MVETSTIKPEGKGSSDAVGTAAPWLAEIERYRRAVKPYQTRCAKLERLYRNKRAESESTNNVRRFALFSANVDTLKPAVYAKTPQVVVTRKFKDRDPVSRMATEILERGVQYNLDSFGFNDILIHVRDDFLLYARGTAWVRYEPTFRTIQPEYIQDVQTGNDPYQADYRQDESTSLDADGVPSEGKKTGDQEPYEELEFERLITDFVHRDDFAHSVSRFWEENWWVGRRVYMTRAELMKRWPEKDASGQERGRKIPLDHKPKGVADNEPQEDTWKASVWEIWSKRDNKVFFIAEGDKDIVEECPPFLKLRNFWPCPKPAFGTMTTDSLIPVPDYVYYMDQAEEIDELTAKIGALQDALKLVGFYPQGPSTEGTDAIKAAVATRNIGAELIPVAGWQAFTEKGGANTIQWMPLNHVVEALKAAIELRSQLIQDVYQITGISDIVRGETDPNETATAQGIKSQWGSLRIRDRQRVLAEFASEIVEICGEVIADKFQPETLTQMTGIPLEMPQDGEMEPGQNIILAAEQGDQEAQQELQTYQARQQSKAVMDLLRNDSMRGFRITIATDSTVEPDERAEKEAAVELTRALTEFVVGWGPIIQAQPQMAKMAGELLMFSLRRFKAGRELEQVVEETMAQLSAPPPQQAGPPPPDPVAVKAEADAASSQLKLKGIEAQTAAKVTGAKADILKTQVDTRAHIAKNASDMETAQVEAALAAMEPGGGTVQ